MVKIDLKLRLVMLKSDMELELPENSSVSDVLEEMTRLYGESARRLIFDAAGNLRVIALVNSQKVDTSTKLSDGETVTVLALVSGG
jgi:molybdopterin converting factor small subunit